MTNLHVGLVAIALLAAPVAAQAQSTMITFNTDANIAPFTGTYTQNGYNITYVSGNLRILNNTSAYGDVLAGSTAAGGTFSLSRSDGGTFSLGSFGGGAGLTNTTSTYALTGYVSNVSVYSQTLTGNTGNSSSTLYTLTPTPVVNRFDRVTFAISSNQSSAIVDNLSVTGIAAAPESGSWALMILGFGVVGGALRSRRRAVLAAA